MIKILTYGINILILAALARFVYIDLNRGPFDTTITNQIKADVIHYYQEI